MNMKAKSAVKLIAVLLVAAVAAVFTLCSFQIGGYEIKSIVSNISQGLDLRGGVYAVYQAMDDGEGDFDAKLASTIAVLQTRLTGQGFTEATVIAQGTDRIRVEIPDVQDPEQVLEIIGTPAHLEFVEPDGTVILEGSSVKEAQAGVSSQDGSYIVSFKLDSTGAERFAEATARLVGKTIDITLDGESLFGANPPTVNDAITNGEGMITGNYTQQAAQQLAVLIQSGALPLDIEQIEVRTISATLGEDALSSAITAGVIGVALVMLFMIVMYRLPGVVASLALTIYILIDLILLAIVPGVQLTLPGIAGIILSIGMAVDANVVIFERIKEEMANGKMLRAAIASGYQRAFTAVLDANVTTVIAAVVLGIFGTGTIRGFAITLGIGVVVSMITAVFITRWLLYVLAGFGLTNRALYGVKEHKDGETGKKRNIIGHFKGHAIAVGAVLALAVVMGLFTGGFNLGIDFTGGTLITLDLGGDFATSDVEAVLVEMGISDYSVARTGDLAGGDQANVRIKELESVEAEDAFREDLTARLTAIYPQCQVVSAERVGAVAGKTLVENAVWSVLIASALMLIYIWIRFELVSGVIAVITCVLNVLLMMAAMIFCSSFLQINSSFIAACLTIVGYSINNTIVVLDRIRENNRKLSRKFARVQVAESAVESSMSRMINTTITTLLTITILYVLGVESIREFALPLIIGIALGAYISVCIAPALWGLWMDRAAAKKS